MYYVYILQSRKDRNLYIGCTNDLRKRLILHNTGKVYATRNRKPFRLVCYEAFLRACLVSFFQSHFDDILSEKPEDLRSVAIATVRRSEGFAAKIAQNGVGRIDTKQALSQKDAFNREQWLKTGWGRNRLKKTLINSLKI